MSLATKYYEELGFVDKAGIMYNKTEHLQYAVRIPASTLSRFEIHLVKMIDYNLYIDWEEYE